MSVDARAVLVEQFKNCLSNSSQKSLIYKANTLSCHSAIKVQS